MVLKRLAPAVQQGNRANLSAEMPRVGGNTPKSVGGGSEQDGIDDTLVLERDLRCERRQGEDHMVLGDRQQLGLARFKPFGTR